MKTKTLIVILATLLTLLGGNQLQAQGYQRYGPASFFVGCCFGIRTVGDFNEGKNLQWREWGLLIPVFNIYVGLINGIDGFGGTTTSDLVQMYGSQYY